MSIHILDTGNNCGRANVHWLWTMCGEARASRIVTRDTAAATCPKCIAEAHQRRESVLRPVVDAAPEAGKAPRDNTAIHCCRTSQCLGPDHHDKHCMDSRAAARQPEVGKAPACECPEVYCANDCSWVGAEEDLIADAAGNEPHCPKCGSNSAILDIPDEIRRAVTRYYAALSAPGPCAERKVLTEQIARLIAEGEELQSDLQRVTVERDSLRAELTTARARVEAWEAALTDTAETMKTLEALYPNLHLRPLIERIAALKEGK